MRKKRMEPGKFFSVEKLFLFVIMLFVVVIGIGFTSAAVLIVSPSNYTNASGRIMINISFVNVTDIVEPLSANTTVLYNNAVVPFNNFTCQYLNSCNLTINTSDVADSVGRNLSVILGNATDLRPAGDGGNVSYFLIDNTKPIVFAGNISNPVVQTNYSRNLTINVTVTDATANVRVVVFNITNSTGIQNATYTGIREGTTNQYSFSVNTSHFPDGTYNVTIYANDTTIGGNLNNSASVGLIRFDNTPPIVFAGNISGPVTETNYSRNVSFNVTVTDPTGGVGYIVFNITNISGHQNATYTGIREGTTNQYSFSVNTSHFPDGTYNVTIYANDTTLGGNGNLNNSALIATFRFDNTPPVVFVGNISNPVVQTNYSRNLTINVTVTDFTSGVFNVFFNITDGTGVQNATYTGVREGATNQFSLSINTSHFPDGRFNVTIFANDTTIGGAGNLNNSANIGTIRFDNTPPIVFAGNISSPLTIGNHSRNATLNVTVADGTSSVRVVIFNITNSSGLQNASYIGVREGTTNQFSISINTSHFPDGTYNVTIYANDTTIGGAGNLNNSALTYDIRFDNTPPRVFAGNISNPVVQTNYSRNLTINVTVTDALAGIMAVVFNITNASGTQNGTFTGAREGTTNQFSFSINTSHFPDGTYNVTIYANDTTDGGRGNLNDSANIGTIRFDNTPPIVLDANISSPTPGSNNSHLDGLMKLNISVVDVTSSVRAVVFNVTNSAGAQNATYTATREGGTHFWSVRINTSHFPDGRFNITLKVNDTTAGGNDNLNDSAKTPNVIMDNAPPSISLSCTPDPVTEDTTITCTCSNSDTTSNVKTLTNTLNPSTAGTGSHSTTCTAVDYANNTASTSTTFNVVALPSGTSGSGSSGSGATDSDVQKKTGSWTEIKPDTPAVMGNLGEKYGIKKVTITVNSKATDVKLVVTHYDNKPSSVSTKPGKVYRYLEITPQNLEGELAQALVTVQIEKSWLTDKQLTKGDVALFKYIGGVWTELPTTYKEEDSRYFYYDVSLTSFSYFAIGEKVAPVAEESPSQETPSFAPPETQEETSEEVPLANEENSLGIAITSLVIVLLIILIAIIWLFVRRKR